LAPGGRAGRCGADAPLLSSDADGGARRTRGEFGLPDQDLANPLGVGGGALHGWALSTRTFQSKLFGSDGGQGGIDDDFAARGFANMGAWILGRNMFGPVRGPWPDESWRGWWGDNPVYHVPVFVLTHHARPPLVMEGGTTFHFVTEGIEVALARAREAAQGKDVRWGAASMSSSSTSASG
jgi:dihydrofolate reductase